MAEWQHFAALCWPCLSPQEWKGEWGERMECHKGSGTKDQNKNEASSEGLTSARAEEGTGGSTINKSMQQLETCIKDCLVSDQQLSTWPALELPQAIPLSSLICQHTSHMALSMFCPNTTLYHTLHHGLAAPPPYLFADALDVPVSEAMHHVVSRKTSSPKQLYTHNLQGYSALRRLVDVVFGVSNCMEMCWLLHTRNHLPRKSLQIHTILSFLFLSLHIRRKCSFQRNQIHF